MTDSTVPNSEHSYLSKHGTIFWIHVYMYETDIRKYICVTKWCEANKYDYVSKHIYEDISIPMLGMVFV